MTSKLHAALIAGSAALAVALGGLAAHAGDDEILRAAQQHAAALDAASDLRDMASTGKGTASDAAASVLDDADASEIIDVLMAAISAATEE